MIEVEALGPARVAGLRALFEASSSSCYCRYWHFAGNKNEWLDRCANRPEENAAELEAAVLRGDWGARGLVAIAEGRVVGFMKLVPRTEVPKLRALPVYRALDLGPGDTTYAIGCFLIDPAHRHRGVASALVAAAPRIAASWGARAIEAYPRRGTALHDEEAWQGPESLFRSHGFEAIHDVAPYPVYRIHLKAKPVD